MRATTMMTLVLIVGCGPRVGSDATSSSAEAARLAKHRFWQTPLTAQQVEAMVDQIERSDADVTLVIDEQGKVEDYHGAEGRDFIRDFGPRRRVVFFMNDYDARPTRSRILADFARKLDQADHQPRH